MYVYVYVYIYICLALLLIDVSGAIDGRSGDLTNVGRVARVWVGHEVGLKG